MIGGLSSGIRLDECIHGVPHNPGSYPLIVVGVGDGTVVGPVDGKGAFLWTVGSGVGKSDLGAVYRALFLTEDVFFSTVRALHNGLLKFIDDIRTGGSMHPTVVLIEALIDEKLPPRYRSVSVEAFFADHVYFAAEEKRGMRIDEQHSITGSRFVTGNAL